MFTKWFSIVLWLSLGALLMAACEPGAGGGGVPPVYPLSTANGSPETSDGTVVSSSGNTITSSDPGASAGPGQSGPGAAGGDQTQDPGGGDESTPSPDLLTYTDSTYKFEVEYPSNFTFRTMDADKFAALNPRPEAVFVILSPAKVASDIADQEPADLEVRAYVGTGISSLESWLPSLPVPGGLLPAEPFQTNRGASGVKACAKLMVAPPCSYLFLSNGFIYQLTPASLQGEAMLQTFRLMP